MKWAMMVKTNKQKNKKQKTNMVDDMKMDWGGLDLRLEGS